MKAQKKPVIIDYFDVVPGISSLEGKIQRWMNEFGENFNDHFIAPVDGHSDLKVKTLEGTSYEVTDSDVIIRGVKGEYYPCKRDIFNETYEKL